ncbi:MAG: response regulator [Anaerolineae bacterium]|nr:response regulator [Anaerolineae bacterium]MDW8299752.1 response regulator [Anaerolineae bacterium]
MAHERILVVDDGRENREFIIKYILQPNEYRALEARDGIECLEIVRRDPPDLILLDLQMPRLDGMGVLEALQRERLDIPVILMTFHGSEDIAVEVFRMGVRDYLKKPYTAEEMLNAIERSLAEVRLRREKEALTARLMNANRELHLRVKELNTLYSIGKSVAALLDLQQLLIRIVEAAISLTNAEQARLLLVENNALVLRTAKLRGEQNAQSIAEVVQDRVAERAVSTARPIVLNEAQLEQLRQVNPNVPRAALYVPLLLGNVAIGVLNVENLSQGTRQFTENDAALLSALSDYAAIAIENARNYHALEALRAHHASSNVVSNSIRRGEALAEASRAEWRQISVVVADLRGFSAYAGQQAPEQAMRVLNAYLSLAAETFASYGATLDKAGGDALMALFNVPRDQPEHQLRAVQAALALQAATEQFNARQGAAGLAFAIGVAHGEALVGTISAAQAISYTAVGEPINVAYRLQESARSGQILIEESSLTQLGNRIAARKLGEVTLRSRRGAVTVYEVQKLL